MDLQELTRLYDFSGRCVVITGGAGILGSEIACALVSCRANVAILDRDPALADRLIQRFPPADGRAVVVYADVLKPETLQAALETVVGEFGQVDALRFVFDPNLLGTILFSRNGWSFGSAGLHKGEGGLEWRRWQPDEAGVEQAKVSRGAARPMDITAAAYTAQLCGLVSAIRERRPPLEDGREGRRSLALLDAVYESARTRQPAPLRA